MDDEIKYLKSLSAGNYSGFEAIFMRYYPKVKYFIYSFIKNEEEARDIAQDIFLKIWDKRKNFTEIYNFKPYVYKMARNAVFDYYSKSRLKERYLSVAGFLVPEFEEYTEKIISAKDLEIFIWLVVEKMPEKRKQIFLLSRQNGLSNDDIAKKMDINKRTVENHISNALAELRSILNEVCDFN